MLHQLPPVFTMDPANPSIFNKDSPSFNKDSPSLNKDTPSKDDNKKELSRPLLPTDARVELIHHGDWISFGHVNFTDPVHNKRRQWEFVRRNKHNSSSVDAVDILATVKRAGLPDSVILVAQYRPPVQKMCVEFPAGLVDPGESIATAARRELIEETGYVGKEVYTSSPLFYDAGLSDSNMQLVHIEVDGDAQENIKPQPELEADEWSMQTLVLPIKDLLSSLTELHKKHGYQIDAKLFTYAYAIEMAKRVRFD